VFAPDTTIETVIRFSTVAGERGGPDTWRDPLTFGHFIRSQNAAADNLRDHDMQWDFWTLSPESAHQVTYLMGDRGIPTGWRHMNLYGSHTHMWINAHGEKF
jgi:catalase